MTCAFLPLLAGLALSVAALAWLRGLPLMAGAGNVLTGAGIAIAGSPLGLARPGTVNAALGAALLWRWLRGRWRRLRAGRWMREAARPA